MLTVAATIRLMYTTKSVVIVNNYETFFIFLFIYLLLSPYHSPDEHCGCASATTINILILISAAVTMFIKSETHANTDYAQLVT